LEFFSPSGISLGVPVLSILAIVLFAALVIFVIVKFYRRRQALGMQRTYFTSWVLFVTFIVLCILCFIDWFGLVFFL
jgi:hypothetical protein